MISNFCRKCVNFISYICGLYLVLFVGVHAVVDWQIVGKSEDIKFEMELCEFN